MLFFNLKSVAGSRNGRAHTTHHLHSTSRMWGGDPPVDPARVPNV